MKARRKRYVKQLACALKPSSQDKSPLEHTSSIEHGIITTIEAEASYLLLSCWKTFESGAAA